MRIDSNGLEDHIYTSLTDYTLENDQKNIFGKYKTPQRFFIEVDEIRYQVNSLETKDFYFSASEAERNIDSDFDQGELYEILVNVQNKGVSIQDILTNQLAVI